MRIIGYLPLLIGLASTSTSTSTTTTTTTTSQNNNSTTPTTRVRSRRHLEPATPVIIPSGDLISSLHHGSLEVRSPLLIPPGFVRDQRVGLEINVQFAIDEPHHRIVIKSKSETGPGPSVSIYGEERDESGKVVATLTLIERMFGEESQVSGSFWTEGYLYQVSFDAHGKQFVLIQKSDEFVDEEHIEHKDNIFSRHLEEERVRNLRGDDDPGTLDILVLYTKAAMCLQAGYETTDCPVTAGTQRPVEAMIDLSVYETNLAFQNSKIPTQLRLVHTELDPDFIEAGIPIDQILRWLRDKDDPHFAAVHKTRNLVGADFVSLIIESHSACGVGLLPYNPSAEQAFSVVNYKCSSGYYSFGHEIAHNMGCNHNRPSDLWPGSNWAYWDPEFRTIMSYGNGKRIPYFSSADPTVTFEGGTRRAPTSNMVGNETANNAGHIIQRLQEYANFRQSKVPFGDDTTLQLQTTLVGGFHNQAAGNMFDIRAKQRDVIVTNFAVHAHQASMEKGVPISVYRKRELGPVAYDDSTEPWNYRLWEEIGTFVVHTEGKGEVTRLGNLGDMKPVAIPAGKTQAFYIVYTNPEQNLNTFTFDVSKSIGSVAFQDDYLEVMTGYATHLSATGQLFGDFEADTGYLWNGMVMYTGSTEDDDDDAASTIRAPERIEQPKVQIGQDTSLATTFEGGNSQAGNMFTIQAKEYPVIITSFDIHTSSTVKKTRVLIYTKKGSYEGFEDSKTGWTVICNKDVQGQGSLEPTTVPDNFVNDVTIHPGEMQSFYVSLSQPNILYTNGQDLESMSDEYISFLDSVGKSWPFGATHVDRIWNGKVHYTPKLPDPKGIIGTTIQGGNGSYGMMFNVRAQHALTITSIWFHTHLTEDVPVEVWVPKNFDQGIDDIWNKSRSWKKVASYTVLGKGQGKLTKLPDFSLDIYIPRRKNYALYITLPEGGLRYTESSSCRNRNKIHTTAETTRELIIRHGMGIGSPGFGKCKYDCRDFNGAILYTSAVVNDGTLYLDQDEGEEGWICGDDSECLSLTCAAVGAGVKIREQRYCQGPFCEGLNYCMGNSRFHVEDGTCRS